MHDTFLLNQKYLFIRIEIKIYLFGKIVFIKVEQFCLIIFYLSHFLLY